MTGEFSAAVHALVFLSHKNKTLSSEEIAENVCTNPARIRKIMAKLKKAGLVATRAGAVGGYCLSEKPDQITLDAVLSALDAKAVEATWKTGDTDMDCLIASGMANIMDRICEKLDGRCREELKKITVAEIEKAIFREAAQRKEAAAEK